YVFTSRLTRGVSLDLDNPIRAFGGGMEVPPMGGFPRYRTKSRKSIREAAVSGVVLSKNDRLASPSVTVNGQVAAQEFNGWRGHALRAAPYGLPPSGYLRMPQLISQSEDLRQIEREALRKPTMVGGVAGILMPPLSPI